MSYLNCELKFLFQFKLWFILQGKRFLSDLDTIHILWILKSSISWKKTRILLRHYLSRSCDTETSAKIE